MAVEDQLPQAALQPGVQGQGPVGGIGHPGFDGFEQGVFEQLVWLMVKKWLATACHSDFINDAYPGRSQTVFHRSSNAWAGSIV
ncbi:hypothetical protein ABE607_01895 [Comamonas aquatica]|uniref:hypothetical protein n=1 Tax=Comamonas aquatica TaxID=225991 RepID=UPI0022DDEDB8|nr:hypothetical protein [Comamonas aquatica]WBM44013.1 hypothetical protein M2J84_08375 [Comamonas aquatica]